MPYILSNIVDTSVPGLWGEGEAYVRESIYDINSDDPQLPPVNYDSHLLKPHSIAHIDAPAHIIPGAPTCEHFYKSNRNKCFYGPVCVLRLAGSAWTQVEGMDGIRLWRVSVQELAESIERVTGGQSIPTKVFITADEVPCNRHGFHDPNYVLVLEEEAAKLLVANPNFNAYGTSWKSSDFQPGSRERPIHKILLSQAVLFECLKLDHVPEGRYFLNGFPLPLAGASESPVVPVLFEAHELKQNLQD